MAAVQLGLSHEVSFHLPTGNSKDPTFVGLLALQTYPEPVVEASEGQAPGVSLVELANRGQLQAALDRGRGTDSEPDQVLLIAGLWPGVVVGPMREPEPVEENQVEALDSRSDGMLLEELPTSLRWVRG